MKKESDHRDSKIQIIRFRKTVTDSEKRISRLVVDSQTQIQTFNFRHSISDSRFGLQLFVVLETGQFQFDFGLSNSPLQFVITRSDFG